MKNGLIDILKGKFLVSGDAPKNWTFILFASSLVALMIASAHSADKKVHQVAALNEEVRQLRSEFVAMRSHVQQMKLESSVRTAVVENGLGPSEVPPQKIIVLTSDE